METALIHDICLAFNMGDENEAREQLLSDSSILIVDFVQKATSMKWMTDSQLRRLFKLA